MVADAFAVDKAAVGFEDEDAGKDEVELLELDRDDVTKVDDVEELFGVDRLVVAEVD